jgi:hypothetical protein
VTRTTKPALTAAAIRAFLDDAEEFDSDDDAAVKAAIREITGLARVSQALVDEFRDLLDEVEADEGEQDEYDAEADEGDASAAEDGEEDEDSGEGRSVVKKLYKTRYRPHHHKNGDELGARLTKAVADETGKKTDPDKLFAFAEANGLWNDRYAALNVGMRRMNIANRARAKVKKGGKLVW